MREFLLIWVTLDVAVALVILFVIIVVGVCLLWRGSERSAANTRRQIIEPSEAGTASFSLQSQLPPLERRYHEAEGLDRPLGTE